MTVPALLPVDLWESDGVCPGLPRDVDPAVVQQADAAATEVLWALSGRRYGYRTETIRPCSHEQNDGDIPWWYWPTSSAYGLTWAGPRIWGMSMWCRRCDADGCSCREVEAFRLPRYPVVEITNLTMDGESLPVSGADCIFRVDEWRWLVRTDGGIWPRGQNLSLGLDQPDTWSVSYRWGRAVPALGRQAMGALSCELQKAALDLECQLPQRITSVNRQGMSFTINDPLDFLENGRTGVYLVDLFLTTFNRYGQQRPSRVFRADAPHGGRRTT